MLQSLHIENVAVIKSVDLDFSRGFNVLTGETGAGKSIIIDSINLLLGNRVPREILRSGEERAVVSAVFDGISASVRRTLEEMGFAVEEDTLLLQRTLFADGKSRTHLNGRAITQAMQKQIAGMLVSIHGQSDNQTLLQKGAHLSLVDAYAHPDACLAEYRTAYAAYRAARRELDALVEDEAEKLRTAEMLRFQLSDIDAVKLKAGEEDALVRERDRLLHIEKINKQVAFAYHVLYGSEKNSANELLVRAANALRTIDGLVEGAGELSKRLLTAASEVEDIAETVREFSDDDREDPTARIDRLEGRLDAIARLKKKYGATVEEVLAFRERAAERLSRIENADELRATLAEEVKQRYAVASACAERLHALRVSAAEKIEAEVTEALAFLDMPKVRFSIDFHTVELNADGADDAEFLIATNPGEPMLPMVRIASGGELSRIMLALRSVINDRDGAETVIFDEVDTGVSGKTARKVGMKLAATATDAQVLCVTHSAQIASLADDHYRIVKTERDGRAETEVIALDLDARVEEIARILGGIEVTDLQRETARQLISEYRA
jgi:DNA repair protein RecN (Recombination protein N)